MAVPNQLSISQSLRMVNINCSFIREAAKHERHSPVYNFSAKVQLHDGGGGGGIVHKASIVRKADRFSLSQRCTKFIIVAHKIS